MNQYASGEYTKKNPTYHTEHSARKSDEITAALEAEGSVLAALKATDAPLFVEVGCGAGGVLAGVRDRLAARGISAKYAGYDLNPDAIQLAREGHPDLEFEERDVTLEPVDATVMMMIDFFEHLPDDAGFLRAARALSRYFVFRIPLDMNAYNVVFRRLRVQRDKLGRLHYYTPRSALKLLRDCGYEPLHHSFVDNFRDPSHLKSLGARVNYVPRAALTAVSQELNAYAMGGTSLVVIAKGGPLSQR